MSEGKIFRTEQIGTTLVVMPLANISSLAGENVQPELDAILGEIERCRIRNVVADMRRVDYFGSVMLAAMCMMWKRVRDRDGRMFVSHLSDLGKEILQVAKFDLLWPICATREEALQIIARG